MTNTTQHIDGVQLPSDKKFGLLFFGILLALSIYFFMFKHKPNLALVLGALSGLFLIVSLVRPALLGPLNILWFKFGLLLGKIVNPIVMGVMFFALVTPVAFFARLFGRDVLKLKLDDKATSYWVDRNPIGPDAESFKNQF